MLLSYSSFLTAGGTKEINLLPPAGLTGLCIKRNQAAGGMGGQMFL